MKDIIIYYIIIINKTRIKNKIFQGKYCEKTRVNQ